MARILFLSPLPPARTGVASYAESVLGELRASGLGDRHELEAPWPPPDDHRVAAADLAVYHIGNNERFHGELFRLATTHPGLVVLHELGLDDLVRRWTEAGDPLGDRIARDAEAGRARLRRAGAGITGPLETPWCAYLVRRARGVIVHSSFGRDYLEGFGSLTPAFVAPHPPIPGVERGASRRATRRVRRALRAAGDRMVVGVLGDLGSHKGIDAVLRAAAALRDRVHVALVGRTIPGFDAAEAVRAAGVEETATVMPDVDDQEFLAWVHACDVVVNLRHPHRGEVSGTVIRSLQAGVPTVVSATGTYLDLPEDTVVRVSPGPPRAAELTDVLGGLADDPARRRALGDRARAHMAGQASERRTARAYEEAIERTLAVVHDPARPAIARWAAALTDLGATREVLDRGLGLRYVEALNEMAAGQE